MKSIWSHLTSFNTKLQWFNLIIFTLLYAYWRQLHYSPDFCQQVDRKLSITFNSSASLTEWSKNISTLFISTWIPEAISWLDDWSWLVFRELASGGQCSAILIRTVQIVWNGVTSNPPRMDGSWIWLVRQSKTSHVEDVCTVLITDEFTLQADPKQLLNMTHEIIVNMQDFWGKIHIYLGW